MRRRVELKKKKNYLVIIRKNGSYPKILNNKFNPLTKSVHDTNPFVFSSVDLKKNYYVSSLNVPKKTQEELGYPIAALENKLALVEKKNDLITKFFVVTRFPPRGVPNFYCGNTTFSGQRCPQYMVGPYSATEKLKLYNMKFFVPAGNKISGMTEASPGNEAIKNDIKDVKGYLEKHPEVKANILKFSEEKESTDLFDLCNK